MITVDILKGFSEPDLRTYVTGRLYEVPPADPPLKLRQQEDYYHFLVHAAATSREDRSPLALRMAHITTDLFEDIQRKTENGEPKDPHATAVANLSIFSLSLREELRGIPNGVPSMERIAESWTELETDSRSGFAGRLILNALTTFGRQGDDTSFWRRMWGKEDRSDLWGLSYIGLVRANNAEGIQELSVMKDRMFKAHSKSDINVGLDPFYHLYVEIREKPETLAEFAREFHRLALDSDHAARLIQRLEGSSDVQKTYIKLLLDGTP